MIIITSGTNCALPGGINTFFHLVDAGVKVFFHAVEGGGKTFFILFVGRKMFHCAGGLSSSDIYHVKYNGNMYLSKIKE